MNLRYATAAATVIVALALNSGPALADHIDHNSDVSEPFAAVGALADKNLPPQAKPGSGLSLRRHGTRGFDTGKWAIDLPGRGRTVARRAQQKITGDGRGATWIGRVEGAEGGLVSITRRDDLISGFIDDGRRYWVIDNAGPGLYRLFEVDTSLTPPPAAPLRPVAEPTGGGGDPGGIQPSGGTVIQDVLVAYTPEVTARYGGTDATEAAIVNHVAAMNYAYANSLVNIQMNLVGTVELAQAQSGDMGTTLARLRSTSDGWYDEVHALRNQLGADLVAMLTTETQYCGIAYLNRPQLSGEDSWAFSVISAYPGYSCLPLTLAHEIGHNQGLCHNHEETGCTTPAYAYGYGYRVCGSFRTVMSYACAGATRIYNFANPNVLYSGVPTGIAYDVDPDYSSEASRALNDSAVDVAAWRAGCSLATEPAAPFDLAAAASSSSEITVSWTDGSLDESAFELERSPDGATGWTRITTLGANGGSGGTVSAVDGNLDPATTFFYRVRAINCAGSSIYTGPASATTDSPPPPPPDVPSSLVAVVAGSTEVDLNWNLVAGADSYEIGRSYKFGKGNKWTDIEPPLSATTAPTTDYADTDVGAGDTYRYYVRARNASGVSAWSSAVQVTVGDVSGGGGRGSKGCNSPKKACGEI